MIGVNVPYAPNEFINPETGAIQGWDIDFGNAICKVMGVVCTFNNVLFDNIIPQLKASTPRYLFSISSWTPTQAREDGGIDFITYYRAGEAWVVKASGGPTVNTAADMCGHTLSVQTGTTEESDAWGFMGKQVGGTPISGDKDNCTTAGKKDMTFHAEVIRHRSLTPMLAAGAFVKVMPHDYKRVLRELAEEQVAVPA